MLAVGGQCLEEVRAGVVAEIGVSLLKGEQLRVLVSGIGQGAEVIIPGEKCRGSECCRVKRPEDRIK